MYYSQHGEDKWIHEHLTTPGIGVFVEVGAHDGVNLSNTKFFEEQAWRGLCIEADPRLWHPLLQNRQCKKFFGAVGSNPNLAFDMCEESTWSGFKRAGNVQGKPTAPVMVPTLPLRAVLDAYDIWAINVLSLDTEGTELDVWDSGHFGSRPYPSIVIIEWETAGLPSNEARIMEHFKRLPYELVHRNVGNLIFQLT